MLVAKLDGDAARPYLGRVAVGHREAVIARFHPRPRAASVAVPVTADGDAGEVILVSRRSSINGHTGLPMDNAGEVVLLGGAAEPGEPAPLAAVRELGEEAGVPAAADLSDLRYDPYLELGRWCTEGGFRARGFLVRGSGRHLERVAVRRARAGSDRPCCARRRVRRRAADAVASRRRARARSAAAVRGLVRVADPRAPRRRRRAGVGAVGSRRPDDREPACALPHARRPARGPRPASALPGAPSRGTGGVLRPRRPRAADASPDGRAARDTRPPVLYAPTLSALLGQPALLVVDAALPLGGSGKARSLAGTLQGALEARAERDGRSGCTPAQLFEGVTLITASTGSHARAVVALASWIEQAVGARPPCELFVSADITAVKLAALRRAGAVTICRDFNEATGAASAREAELARAGQRAVFLPCDPEPRLNVRFGVSGMDGAAGFATLLLDVLAEVRDGWAALGLDGPRLGELRIPTSGPATWAACTALHRDLTREDADDSTAGATLDAIAAVYDVAAPCLPRALAAGDPRHRTEVDWPRAINGLAQPQMAPGAWSLLGGGRATGAPLYAVSGAAAGVAQALTSPSTRASGRSSRAPPPSAHGSCRRRHAAARRSCRASPDWSPCTRWPGTRTICRDASRPWRAVPPCRRGRRAHVGREGRSRSSSAARRTRSPPTWSRTSSPRSRMPVTRPVRWDAAFALPPRRRGRRDGRPSPHRAPRSVRERPAASPGSRRPGVSGTAALIATVRGLSGCRRRSPAGSPSDSRSRSSSAAATSDRGSRTGAQPPTSTC